MVEPETMEDLLSDEGSYAGEDPGDKAITEVLKESCWMYYCLFSGWGFAPCSKACDPCCLGVYKCLCCEGYNGTTDCWNQEGCCMSFNKCCCFVQAGSFPPGTAGDGLPCCAICNFRMGGDAPDADLAEMPSETKVLLEKTFLVYYCCCYGQGCLRGGSMCKGTNKFLCIHSNQETADCCGENGCCYSKQKVCCFISASACPPGGGPNDGVPACALCGKTCGGESAPEEEEDYYDEEEGPEQMEMM
jgi:hypothetical protein